MIIIKRAILYLLCPCILLFSGFFLPSNPSLIAQSEISDTQRTIIIDAGHGGFDGGAEASDGTLEKDINLAIATRLKFSLVQGGFDVIMIRDTDESLEEDSSVSISKRKVSDMKYRLNIVKSNPDGIFVSIHMNKFTTAFPSGCQVFYSPNTSESSHLAQSIQDSFSKYLQLDNDRTIKKSDKSIYLLHNASVPAVIVECGFLSNQKELERLKTEIYQTKTALVIYNGILNFYNIQE